MLICVLFHTILFDHYHIVLHKAFMNILHTLFLLFCIGKICCSDERSETLQELPTLSVTKLSDSPVEFLNITNFPAELRLIIADYSNNLKGACCLFTKEERDGENSVYYKHILKKYLEKIVPGIAVKNLQCENYEKDISRTWKYSLRLVSAHFIATLDTCYKKFMDNSRNVVTHCNAKLFTLESGLLLRELCPQINIVSSEEIYTSDENVMLQAAIITKQDETCTLHRIMNHEDFFEYLDTHFFDTTAISRVIVFKKYQSSDFILTLANNKKYFRLFDIIKDEEETPLLCKLIENETAEGGPEYSYLFIKTIIDMGANINVTTKNGYTPLLLCPLRFGEDDEEVAELLISRGADVNVKTIYGDSVLHIAVISKRRKMVKLLLENGAQINAENNSKKTPLDLAIRSQHTKIQELLIKKGAHQNVSSHNRDKNPMEYLMRVF